MNRVTPICTLYFAVLAIAMTVCAPAARAQLEQGESKLQNLARTAQSVDDAVATIIATLEDQGLSIPLVVNHAAAADSVGLSLRPTQVIMARLPRSVERGLLRRSGTVGIDLPVKVLVFEDADGAIQLRVNSIGYLTDRHDLSVSDWAAGIYSQITEQFVDPADGLVTIESNQGLDATLASLQAALAGNDAFRVPLVLNYNERSNPGGPVLVVFGNPNAGTPLMQATQEVALDLPQKMLIWHENDRTFITYNDPFYVAARHGVVDQKPRLNAISTALANFAAAAAGEP